MKHLRALMVDTFGFLRSGLLSNQWTMQIYSGDKFSAISEVRGFVGIIASILKVMRQIRVKEIWENVGKSEEKKLEGWQLNTPPTFVELILRLQRSTGGDYSGPNIKTSFFRPRANVSHWVCESPSRMSYWVANYRFNRFIKRK